MAGFQKPTEFEYEISVGDDRKRLRERRKSRGVPARGDGHLLVATWNVANLGAKEQVREPECFELLAEIVACFDLVAVQEVRDDVAAGIRRVREALPEGWGIVFSETGGNDERFAFLWDRDAAELGQMVGKVTFEPHELARAGDDARFIAFSRTPYIATFHRGDLALMLVSVHSYFGKPRNPVDMARRLAETKAIGWWCERESRNPEAYTKDIVALGDFNTPSEDDMALAEEMLDELRERGLHTPRYTPAGSDAEEVLETQIGTAVRSENHYDQLLFSPAETGPDLADWGVFDFDGAIFHDLWEERIAARGEKAGRTEFNAYVAWAISDHRPLWGQFRVP